MQDGLQLEIEGERDRNKEVYKVEDPSDIEVDRDMVRSTLSKGGVLWTVASTGSLTIWKPPSSARG